MLTDHRDGGPAVDCRRGGGRERERAVERRKEVKAKPEILRGKMLALVLDGEYAALSYMMNRVFCGFGISI